MSSPTCLKHARRAAIGLASVVAFVALPAAAQAAPVNLGTAAPFVVLGGSAVTNTGPSVLNGELGVSPGTALTGFGAAVVNGATHNNDAVASKAQADLTTAYLAAAGQPVTSDMTGLDLGNRTVTPGNYRYSTSAQLTGPLTLDAQGNAGAQFVFMIGSTLTTASASSVVLINGASPCNVFWQMGSSATLGTGTAFQGNLLALTSITLTTGASVIGRALARNGAVTLDTNVLNGSACGTSTTAPGTTPGDGSTPGTVRNGTARFVRLPRRGGNASGPACTAGFRARVRGRAIKAVVFSLDGRRVGRRTKSPFQVYVRAASGRHRVRARVTFKDATAAKTLMLRYRACASASLSPRRGSSRFTG